MAPPLEIGKVYLLVGQSYNPVVRVLEMRNDGWARVIEKNGPDSDPWSKQETWATVNAYAQVTKLLG